MITVDVNPYFDAFIRWQFNTLKRLGKIMFGKRLSIFSPNENQPCADHDRASGEGVVPQEYTAIKLRLVSKPPPALQSFVDEPSHSGVFLLCATLRPETMYGQVSTGIRVVDVLAFLNVALFRQMPGCCHMVTIVAFVGRTARSGSAVLVRPRT